MDRSKTMNAPAPLDRPHRFLPAGDENESKTLLMLHGTGGDEDTMLELGVSLLPGAAILSPRGSVREGSANRWFRRFAEGVFDEDDIRMQAEDLAEFVRAATLEYRRDPAQTIAVGFSNGANMASALLLLHPDCVGGALALRGMLPLTPTPLPNLHSKRAMIISGNSDPLAPLPSALALVRLLSECSAKVRHEILPVGHNLVSPDLDLGRQWLKGLD